MTNKQKIIYGSVAGVVAVFGIILFLFMGQSNTNPTTSQNTSKLPKIDNAKVEKRINHELFTMSGFGTYIENIDNYDDNTYVDGETLGSRTITGAVADSIGFSHEGEPVGSFFDLLEKDKIVDLKTKWEPDGNAFVARGYFIDKVNGEKYPFAFEFNADYRILQEWFGDNIKI